MQDNNHVTRGYSTHRVDGGIGVDLQRVDVIGGVLEQAVVRIKHLVTQEVQPLPGGRDRNSSTADQPNQIV